MGEDFDPLTTENSPEPLSHREILVLMAAVAIAGALIGSAVQGIRFGVGVLVGSGLAFVNYIWLDRSTRAIFDNTAVTSAGWLAMKYIMRYVALGAVLVSIYLTGVVPVIAVIAGLGAFAVAVVIHGLKTIFKS